MRNFRTLATGFTFLEGPRWRDGKLWVSDFYTYRVVTVDMDGRTEEVCNVPAQPSGLGWLPDGRLLIVSMKDRKVLRQEANGELVVHADLASVASGHCNDMVVDAAGRAYVGNFGFDLMGGGQPATTNLARVDPDGSVSVVAEDLYFPNGSMIAPDGRTLLVGETFGNRYSAFEIHDDGALGPRRDWAVFGPLPPLTDLNAALGAVKMAPDGATLDAEGAVWFADALGQRLVRVREGGEVLETISTAPMNVFACMLGGPDGRTLFACVAPDFAEENRKARPEAELWMTEVEVPHAGLP